MEAATSKSGDLTRKARNRSQDLVRDVMSRVGGKAGPAYTEDTYFRIRNKTTEQICLPVNGREITVLPGKVQILDGAMMNTISSKLQEDKKPSLKEYEEQEKISIKDLDIKPQVNYTLYSETDKLIGINHYSSSDDDAFKPLVIPPFGSRWLNSEELKEYDFLAWKRLKLITVNEMKEQEPSNTAQLMMSVLVLLFGLFLLVTIPAALIFTGRIDWQTIGVGSAIFVVLISAVSLFSAPEAERHSRRSSLWEWLKLTPGIVMVLLAGVGLPLGIVYLFGDGRLLLESRDFSLAALGRLMQVGFISVAAILPALLFYLFGRQQIEKLREQFYRELIVLDPNIHTLSEARTKYDPLLDSVYGAGNSNSPFALVLLIISTALLVMGWVMVLSPVGPVSRDVSSMIAFFTPDYTVFSLGFLGTYFFAVNMIFRRYIRADLTPKTYAYITVRLLITLVLVWAISTLPEFAGGTAVQASLLTVAFVIGIFPETGLALIMDRWKKITRMSSQLDDAFPLGDLEGMNLYDRTRLLEEGIENIENLAHHNLVELIARTRIPTPRLVDMFDQAILYMHLGIRKQEDDPGKALLDDLKSYGIRTATDLIRCLCRNEELKLEEKFKLPVERLKVIEETLNDDEWLDYILNWRSTSRATEPITNPYEFYSSASRLEAKAKQAQFEAPSSEKLG